MAELLCWHFFRYRLSKSFKTESNNYKIFMFVNWVTSMKNENEASQGYVKEAMTIIQWWKFDVFIVTNSLLWYYVGHFLEAYLKIGVGVHDCSVCHMAVAEVSCLLQGTDRVGWARPGRGEMGLEEQMGATWQERQCLGQSVFSNYDNSTNSNTVRGKVSTQWSRRRRFMKRGCRRMRGG